MSEYKFYMQGVVWSEEHSKFLYKGAETYKDLEKDFKGLKYCKCEGLNAVGERQVYTEQYDDDNMTRVYMSKTPIYKSTDIKLTLVFVGDDRQKTFDEFNEYISEGFHAYWDTARNKRVIFYVSKPIVPSEDMFKGSTPYIEVTYTLSNVYGKAFNV